MGYREKKKKHHPNKSDPASYRSRSRSRSRSPFESRKPHHRRKSRNRTRKRSLSNSSSDDTVELQLKAFQYVTSNKARRLRKLLRRHGGHMDISACDSRHRTLLHYACACGYTDIVELLLHYGASATVQDVDGDAPAHLAARAGHLEALAEVLRAPTPTTMDAMGAGGVTLRDLLGQALGQSSTKPVQGDAPPEHEGASAWPATDAIEAGDAPSEDDDARWQRRLREEHSDAEGDGCGGWGGGAEGADAGGAGLFNTTESDDEWASRLWREMQQRRRAAAAASAAAFTTDLRAEAARRAAEAAERSQRILQEETAKDAAWRRRTLAAIQAGPVEAPVDLTAARVCYDERWAQLETDASRGAPLRYWDIPWPLEPPGGVKRPENEPQPPPLPSPPAVDTLREFILLGANGPADVKRRVRGELLRWHPDKFGARFGARLGSAGTEHREAGLARVQQLAQVLTQVLGAGGQNVTGAASSGGRTRS